MRGSGALLDTLGDVKVVGEESVPDDGCAAHVKHPHVSRQQVEVNGLHRHPLEQVHLRAGNTCAICLCGFNKLDRVD